MAKKVLLVSVPASSVKQTQTERSYWKWHYALKSKLTYPNLSEKQLLKLGNAENQNVGLLSIASTLKTNGIDVQYFAPFLCFSGDKREQKFLASLLEKVDDYKPDFIGFSSHTCGIPTAINYAMAVKKALPEIRTIIGGPHANGSSRETLEELIQCFDFVIRGKGELPFLKLVQGTYNYDGVCYKRGNRRTETSISINTVFPYPNPANNLLNIKELPAARIYSSLGCRKGTQCVFCADILHNKRFVTKPTEDVIAEIKYLYYSFGTRYFYFGDENLFFDKKRALQIMDEIDSLDLDITVGYQVRIESVDEDLIKKAAKSGKCTEIQYGVESASQEILDINRKGLRIQKTQEICDLTNSCGINTHCYFLVGLPGETRETAQLTITKMEELLRKGSVDFIEYRCAVPFPGAPMWESADDYGVRIRHKDWKLYRGENPPPFDLDELSSTRIYGFYLEGLKKITEQYRSRYLREFGEFLFDAGVLSSVIEGGF